MSRCAVLLTGALLLTSSPLPMVRAADWPAFRGPDGSGVSTAKNVPTKWSADENVVWKAELPGGGNGSPIVAGGRVYVTSATSDGAKRSLHAFDLKAGTLLWTKTVEAPAKEPTHQTNPYAGTTPAAAGDRVVVFHGTPGLYCYDTAGNEKWRCDVGEVKHVWGYGTSPLIHGDRVYLNVGPGKRTYLAAIDLKEGRLLWQHDEPGGAFDKEGGGWIGSWSTPRIVQVDDKEQLLCSLPTRVVGIDPASGAVLWSCTGLENMPKGNLVYTSLVVGDGLVVAMGGFQGPAIGLKLGGKGDVTESNRLWRVEKGNPQRIGSGVMTGGLVYMANAGPGVAQCIDPQTGEEKWKNRLPGGAYWGSLVLIDGKLFATAQDGTTVVFLAEPSGYKELSVNRLGEPSNATPAPTDGRLVIRTAKTLWCLGE